MNNSIKEVQSPEERELELKRVELLKLSEQLAEKELELMTLRGKVLYFEQRYLLLVGKKYVELDELKAKIAEKISRKNPKSSAARKKATKARKHAKETAKKVHSREIFKKATKNFLPSDDLKTLYRQIALKIHPDRSSDGKNREYRTKLMAEANAAYAALDIKKLKELLNEWESSAEAVAGEGIAFDLVRVIRSINQINNRLQVIEEEINNIMKSEMYKLMIKVEDAEKNGRSLLDELANKVDEDIELAREKFVNL